MPAYPESRSIGSAPSSDAASSSRVQEGRYVPVPRERSRTFRSSVPGFWLDVEWLTTPELPNDYDYLQLLLNS
ncbi:MAG: hypothetical protein AB1758_17210 [Candidatus Eremiobacterota bacterium]